MATSKDRPRLPLVKEDTIFSTVVPIIESPCEMNDYIDGALDRLECENPALYTVLASKYEQTRSLMEEQGLDEDTTECVCGNILTMLAMTYGLLDSQLEVDYLNQRFQPKQDKGRSE